MPPLERPVPTKVVTSRTCRRGLGQRAHAACDTSRMTEPQQAVRLHDRCPTEVKASLRVGPAGAYPSTDAGSRAASNEKALDPVDDAHPLSHAAAAPARLARLEWEKWSFLLGVPLYADPKESMSDRPCLLASEGGASGFSTLSTSLPNRTSPHPSGSLSGCSGWPPAVSLRQCGSTPIRRSSARTSRGRPSLRARPTPGPRARTPARPPRCAGRCSAPRVARPPQLDGVRGDVRIEVHDFEGSVAELRAKPMQRRTVGSSRVPSAVLGLSRTKHTAAPSPHRRPRRYRKRRSREKTAVRCTPPILHGQIARWGQGGAARHRGPRTQFRETGWRRAAKPVKAVAGDEHRLRHLTVFRAAVHRDRWRASLRLRVAAGRKGTLPVQGRMRGAMKGTGCRHQRRAQAGHER